MKQAGVTLIEMMIVLLIMGLLAIAASPFTSAWTDSAKVSETQSVIEQAIGRAKASALRNPVGIASDAPASALCFADGNLRLVNPTVANKTISCDVAPSVPWSASISSRVEIDIGDLAWVCSCFTNKGQLTKAGACNVCGSSLALTISAGEESESVNFF